MAIRVIPYADPRIIIIPRPQVNESVQDLSDDIKDWEDEPGHLTYPVLVSTSGKEDLGGGVSVGITAQLQNAQVAFDQRPFSVTTGSVTTADTDGLYLNDTGATFISDGVQPGAWIVNMTDQSVGTVFQVESEIRIRLMEPLLDGTDNQWDSADTYKIWNVIQVSIDGGNLVAVDDVGGSISAIFPTFGTQVLVTSSSSATLTETDEIRDLTYLGEVFIDTVSGIAGTEFPLGNQSNPVNNLPDGNTILTALGFSKFKLRGSIALDMNYMNINFISSGAHATNQIDLNSYNIDDCSFINLNIVGIQNGGYSVFEGCLINGVTDLNGLCENTGLAGTISLASGSSLIFDKCHSHVAGTGTPIIDFQGHANTTLQFRQYSGGMELRNMTNASNMVSFDMVSGHLVIDASCTDGTIVVRGSGHITNNATGVTIVDKGLVVGEELNEVHRLRGLDRDNPMTATPTKITAGDIEIDITGDGETTSTATRV